MLQKIFAISFIVLLFVLSFIKKESQKQKIGLAILVSVILMLTLGLISGEIRFHDFIKNRFDHSQWA